MGTTPSNEQYCVNFNCKNYDRYVTFVCDDCTSLSNSFKDALLELDKTKRIVLLENCIEKCADPILRKEILDCIIDTKIAAHLYQTHLNMYY